MITDMNKVDIPEIIPEEEPSGAEEMYDDFRKDPNNISYWFPKIKDVKEFRIPKTTIIQVPNRICDCFWAYDGPRKDTFQDEVYEWTKSVVIPKLKEENFGLIFVKNGGFSNKFDFNSCTPMASALPLANAILSINYEALCLDAGGVTELAIRERIQHPFGKRYHIYNGMPLVPEIRVFYDFNMRKVLYSVNYWDADYCEPQISHNPTDALAYAAVKNKLELFFLESHEKVEEEVAKAMENVDLTGQWSVDLMWDDTSDCYWLIDMAVAQQSAYWNPIFDN